ncbi:MAG: hypothetical protein WC300_00835 [Candidatus Omnitrophota bacterium]|jgi:hypothetical protein
MTKTGAIEDLIFILIIISGDIIPLYAAYVNDMGLKDLAFYGH